MRRTAQEGSWWRVFQGPPSRPWWPLQGASDTSPGRCCGHESPDSPEICPHTTALPDTWIVRDSQSWRDRCEESVSWKSVDSKRQFWRMAMWTSVWHWLTCYLRVGVRCVCFLKIKTARSFLCTESGNNPNCCWCVLSRLFQQPYQQNFPCQWGNECLILLLLVIKEIIILIGVKHEV